MLCCGQKKKNSNSDGLRQQGLFLTHATGLLQADKGPKLMEQPATTEGI